MQQKNLCLMISHATRQSPPAKSPSPPSQHVLRHASTHQLTSHIHPATLLLPSHPPSKHPPFSHPSPTPLTTSRPPSSPLPSSVRAHARQSLPDPKSPSSQSHHSSTQIPWIALMQDELFNCCVACNAMPPWSGSVPLSCLLANNT